ncbi:probable 26S proteasome non-ATPase regulatory subunit 3 [Macrobrachium rosenbergii]|uniref:probable 26S proteasome non-ATPase regulatory subunit 3 n=1 Tax=Macrobrachium rosenbergii TaxID=79674 RepID=UPI0034D54FB3
MTVEAMDVDVSKDKEKEKEPEEKKDPDTLTIEDLKEHIRLVERSIVSKEPRFVLRVLRALPATRRKLTPNVLRRLIALYFNRPENKQEKENILQYVEELMDTETVPQAPVGRQRTQLALEVDVYIHLLVLLRLLDTDRHADAIKCSDQLMTKVTSVNRRTLDLLAARCYFYHSRAYEVNNRLEEIRGFLHQRLCQATLRKDHEGQAVLINCLLRNYLHYSLYDQAQKLIVKLEFPQQANNNEVARYHYYMGRIKGIQLEYSEAHKHLIQALRKAPQQTAVGFRQSVQKLAVVVELLLGDIPERQIFRQAIMRRALAPYLQLTQAVRLGNLVHFTSTLNEYKSKFQEDHTFMLILRLRHNVIKTGLRAISLSYSRISLADVASKLTLGSREDAEFIVAKAIRDGVIEAVIDHEHGYMQSKETVDIYCTREPQSVYHQRISFCLDIHNQSVKAMRYPPKSYNKDLESAEERREREQQDLELAKEMAEEEDDGFP